MTAVNTPGLTQLCKHRQVSGRLGGEGGPLASQETSISVMIEVSTEVTGDVEVKV